MLHIDVAERGRVRVEPGAKRVRAYVAGVAVADTARPVLVWEIPYYPAYYFPRADVRTEVLVPSATRSHSPSRGEAEHFSIKVGDEERTDAALCYPESPIPELRDLVRFEWGAIDAWFEEDEQVYVHPRNPYTRVDILESSRHVVVELDGVVLADSSHPHVLFETGLPPRWYVPKVDVRMDLLVPSERRTHCPYKGEAHHFSARLGDRTVDDVAWSYPTPLPESQKITGLVAFYDERVDVTIDGERRERPKTKFA